ncbi:MAG: cyclodeaminase/cyclohydrolase family protein [Chloroflexi bacterium]|nr:cyclodeaminase/cyclohydrolase family protein [Chloroflexota bacterium]
MNHPALSTILDLRLGEFLDRLGSSDPTPGGGAAAAVVGALGAALVEMTANLTLGRPRLADVQEQAKSIQQRAAELRKNLERLGDADAEAFDHVGAAYKLPRGDDAQKAERAKAVQAALKLAADVPLETARVAAQVIALAEEAAPILNPAVISDVLVGALLAQSAISGAALNVEINLAAMTDAESKRHYSDELASAREGIDAAVERILASGRSRFGR